MEDVQDGKKVSIQDGVTEDPVLIEKLNPEGKTAVMLMYVTGEMDTPEISSELLVTTDSVLKTASMSTVLVLQVV